MERVRHVELTHGDTRSFQGARSMFDSLRRTRQHHFGRAVHRGEIEGEAVTSPTVARTASMPPPAGSCCIRRPRATTSRHASSRLNHLGDGGCGVLADAVSEQPGRFGTELELGLCLRILQREDRGLGEPSAIDTFVVHHLADSAPRWGASASSSSSNASRNTGLL